MNQRITKLVRQALKDSVSIRVESVIAGSIDGHGIIEIPNSFAEKFAELIVKECVQTLNTEIDRLCEYKNSLPEYSNHSQREDVDLVVEKCHDNIQMIKQHFGVEE
jgi:hypothetical protein